MITEVVAKTALDPNVIAKERENLVKEEEGRGIHSFIRPLFHSANEYCLLDAGATDMNTTWCLPLRSFQPGRGCRWLLE